MSSFPFLLEQVYTFDSLFMLLGCKAGLECLCIQTSQVLSCSVVPCSWQGLWPHLPSRCARTWGSQGRRKRTPLTPLLLSAGTGLQMLLRFCPMTSYTDVCLANGLMDVWPWNGAAVLPLPSSSIFSLPRSRPIYEFYTLFQITLMIQALRVNQGNFLFFWQEVMPCLQLPFAVDSKTDCCSTTCVAIAIDISRERTSFCGIAAIQCEPMLAGPYHRESTLPW